MEYDPITKRVISGPVSTLKSFASRVLSSHISSLNDIGDTPYSLVAPFLAQCSAIQLGDIELRSPHIRKESRELWKRLVLSDFFEVRIPYEKQEMKEPRNWRKVYIAAHEARQQKELDGKARLKDSYKALEEKREARKLVFDPRIKGEPKKSASSSGWSSSSSSKSSSSSIISKTREKTKGYSLSFKQPISRPRPPPRPYSNPSSSSGSNSSSIRSSSSFVLSRKPSIPPPTPSISTSSNAKPQPTSFSKPISTSTSKLKSKSSSSSSPTALTFSSVLETLPPPLSYRAPSSSSSLPGSSSGFLGLSSRPIDASERFVIPSARTKAAERERIVPRGCYIPPSARDEGTTKVAAVDFFGKGPSAGRSNSSEVVKVSSVVVGRSGSIIGNGGSSKSKQPSSPPASSSKSASTSRLGPPLAFPDDLPLPVAAPSGSRLGLGGGSGVGFARGGGQGAGAMSPPLMKRREPTSMFIPPPKRKKVVH
ncbi:RNA polymerase II transcription factor SIII subunit A-domain-containing protein [Mrakia frigida]|uniref:elongin A domain-containing protein n=1 Tax=Mrakia frigida TaxID=29902 RepID=UPI003FCC1BA4